MNYSTAVFLINKNVRAIMATYESEDVAKRTAFKTLDPDIKVGDYIIVPTDTRHKMTVCKVVETDVDLDFDSTVPVLWVIGVVDRSDHEKVLEQEGKAIQAIKSAELHKKRNDLRDAMLGAHLDTIKALPIAALNGDAPAAEPKV